MHLFANRCCYKKHWGNSRNNRKISPRAHVEKISVVTFRRNIERNDVANGRNIARNGASKWLLGHNVRPVGVKKDIAIVRDHGPRGGSGDRSIKGARSCGFSDSENRFGQHSYINPMTLPGIRASSLFHYMTDKVVQWSVPVLVLGAFQGR